MKQVDPILMVGAGLMAQAIIKQHKLRTSPKAMEALKSNESSVVVDGKRYEIEEPSRQRRRALERERLKAFNRHKKMKLK